MDYICNTIFTNLYNSFT